MSFPSQISATELLLAFRSVAQVLVDHEGALNQLQAEDDEIGLEVASAPDQFEVDLSDPELGTPELGNSPAFTGAGFAGSDLARTMTAAVSAAEGAGDMAHLFEGLRRGSAQGATGEAGRSLATVFAGLAEVLCNLDHLDGQGLALGLEVAAEQLSQGDDGQHRGAMPAVLSATAIGALGAVDSGADLAEVVIAAADEGLTELETGPQSNPELMERGMVDAASAGFLLLLDTLASVLTGEPLPAPPAEPQRLMSGGTKFVVRCEVQAHSGCGLESANWLESTWHELGTLRFFDGIGPIWRAELLTTLPGEAIEAIFAVGRPQNLHIGLASDAL